MEFQTLPRLSWWPMYGVEFYYLTYKAEEIVIIQIILAGRKINDDMGKYCSENVVKNMIKADKPPLWCYSSRVWYHLRKLPRCS